MSWIGNQQLEDTFYFLFTTRQFSTGAPYTLAGTPVLSVYEENNATQITAGVSISADYDSVTGLNQATVVATAANGYEAGKSYEVVITTGTVDSVSVVGEVVGRFRVVPAEASAGVPDVNVASIDNVDFGATMKASITTACNTSCDTCTVTSIGANVITDTAINADAITEAKIADNAIAAEHLAAAAIDEATFAADVNIGHILAQRRVVEKADTDVSTYIMMFNDGGVPVTSVTEASVNMTFVRDGDTAVVETTVTAGSLTVHGDNTITVVNATNAPGLFKVDWPDAMFATGVDRVTGYVKLAGAQAVVVNVNLVDTLWVNTDGQVDVGKWLGQTVATPTQNGVPEVDIVRVDGVVANATNLASACSNYSATRGLSGTALPAAVAGADGGLPLACDASGRVDVGEWLGTTAVAGAIPAAAAGAAGGVILSTTGSDTNTYDGIYAGIVTNATGADVATDVVALKAETVLIVEDTGTTIPGLIATAQTDLDTLTDDVLTEGLDAAPGVSESLVNMTGFLYKAWRNKSDQTSVLYQLYNNAESAVAHKATVGESGGTVTKEAVEAGP